MSKMEQAIVALNRDHHLSVAALARVYGMSRQAMKRRLRRAKRKEEIGLERLCDMVFGSVS